MEESKVILENVKELCNGRGISLARLEREAGVGNGAVARWARGKTPRLKSLKLIADYFGIEMSDLFKGTEFAEAQKG